MSIKGRESHSASGGIRNIFRPFFNIHRFENNRYGARKRMVYWKELQKVRRDTDSGDLTTLCNIVESNASYPFPGLGNTYPQDRKLFPDGRLRNLSPLSCYKELLIAIARINHHAEKLVLALRSLSALNEAIEAEDWELAASLTSTHKENYGLSLVVLKKELYGGSEKLSLTALSRRYSKLIKETEKRPFSLYAHMIFDMADQTHDPVQASRRWLNVGLPRDTRVSWLTSIVKFEILSTAATENELAEGILRYGSLSLLDLLLFLWRVYNGSRHVTDISSAFGTVDKRLREALNERFRRPKAAIHPRYAVQESAAADKEVYRASFFFDEFADVCLWRSDISSAMYYDTLPHTAPDNAFYRFAGIYNFEKEGRSVEEISKLSYLGQIKEECCVYSLFPTLISAISLRQFSDSDDVKVRHALDVIAQEGELQSFITSGDLTRLLKSDTSASNPLFLVVISELAFRKSRTLDNELERRSYFMDLVPSYRKEGIIEVIIEVSRWSKALGQFLARLCTRSFLERLFLIMTSITDVIQVRSDICSWLIDFADANMSALQEERTALTRELANIDARSDLDSTRVHVDEDSLREWFSTTQAPAVTRYVQSVLAEGQTPLNPSMLTFYTMLTKDIKEGEDVILVDSQVGSEVSFLTLFEATLHTFTTDRFFGLNSYLSRRIRHGTLAGHLITPINRMLRRLEEEIGKNDRRAEGLEIWVRNFQAEVEVARKEIIQVRSSKYPSGLIQGTWKNAANVTHLDATLSRVRRRVFESRGNYDIFPDIHALCWDCIESDLAQLRLFVIRNLYPKLNNGLAAYYYSYDAHDRLVLTPFVAEIGQILRVRFQEVCGWFIRPVFRRDEYNLGMLINSIFSVVKELDESYAFSATSILDDDITINRGAFEVIGDALFVLIGNGAKHGPSDGDITVKVEMLENTANAIKLSIRSTCVDLLKFHYCLYRIGSSLKSPDSEFIDIAAVDEGFSGLGKLVGQLRRVKSSDVRLSYVSSEADLCIIFEAALPSVVIFQREKT